MTLRSLPAVMVVLMLVCAGAAPAQEMPRTGENLVANGSLEDSPVGPVPARQVPEGWAAEAYGGSGQLEIVQGGAAGQGEHCVKMTTTDDDPNTGLHGPMIEIDPDGAYVQSGWLRVDRQYQGRIGLLLGRQWFDADGNAVDLPKSRSYNYVPTPDITTEWSYYEQVLLPDQTPDDEQFRADEIPAKAKYLRVWALSYGWAGVGYFDGLTVQALDYAAWYRTRITEALTEADVPAIEAQLNQGLKSLPADNESAVEARRLLAELASLQERLVAQEQRGCSVWIADEKLAHELIQSIDLVRWQVMIQALLAGDAG